MKMITRQQWTVLAIAQMEPPDNWVVGEGGKSTATRLARRGLITLFPNRKGNVVGYDVALTEAGKEALRAYYATP
jgi:hypothetical protein